ncbi:MAG: N,N-dimethylformamidase beta subunit family domain-containing protein, partial [Acidimicrobiales bacterium]
MTEHRHYTGWPLVEGYCLPTSHQPGDLVEVHCASRAERFSAEVALITDRRTVLWSQHGLTADDHPIPHRAWAEGCDWPVAFTVPTESEWPSGFYEISLRADAGGSGVTAEPGRSISEAFFVLRPRADRARKPILVALSTNTYNAYNQWGGRCYYSGAERVSFARPLERGYLRRPAAPFDVDFDGRVTNIAQPSDPEHRDLQRYQRDNHYPLWTASSGWHNWERRFVRWAVAAGFELDVAINSDLHFDPEVLDGHALLVSVGHDEYWTWEMRDTIDRWVEAGGNHAVFSGNTSFWQVRYEDDGRTMLCHRGRARFTDPVRGTDRQHLLTGMWSDPLIGRPETETIGLTFSRGGYHRIGHGVPNGSGAYT